MIQIQIIKVIILACHLGENMSTGQRSDNYLQYEYHCLKMMSCFSDYFKIGELITNTNPTDFNRLQYLIHQQSTCLALYNEHNNYTLHYEKITS